MMIQHLFMKIEIYIYNKLLDRVCKKLSNGKYKTIKEKQMLRLQRMKYGLKIITIEQKMED